MKVFGPVPARPLGHSLGLNKITLPRFALTAVSIIRSGSQRISGINGRQLIRQKIWQQRLKRSRRQQVLQKCILPFAKTDDSDVILGASLVSPERAAEVSCALKKIIKRQFENQHISRRSALSLTIG